MASFRKRGGIWYFRLVDEAGRQVERKGCSDKRATETMAAAAEAEAAKIRQGFITKAEAGAKTAAAKPIQEHLDAFHADQLARGLTLKHADLVRARNVRLLDDAGVDRLPDLTGDRINIALGKMRDAGLSAQSLTHHVRSIKSWVAWLVRGNRLTANPLVAVKTFNAKADRRHVRRALTPDEASRLVAAAEAGVKVKGMTGLERAWCYRLALGTGFRVSELATLTPQSFHLGDDPPTVHLAASASKNRRPSDQPLPKTLAGAIGPWLATLPPLKPIFPRLPVKEAARMLRHDLDAANIAYETDSGLADFHSLRGAFISNLVASGASVKACQQLARHSTAALTFDVYAKVNIHDTAGAVDRLPDLAVPVQAQQPETLAATGTDQHISKCFSLHLPYGRDSTPQFASFPGNMSAKKRRPFLASLDRRKLLSESGLSSDRQSRTAEEVGFEPTEPRNGSTVFKTVPFNHSGTPPKITRHARADTDHDVTESLRQSHPRKRRSEPQRLQPGQSHHWAWNQPQ